MIDLMPAASSARLRGRSALRRWVIAYGGVFACAALAAFSLRLRQVTTARELTKLEAALALDTDHARQVNEIGAAIERRRAEIVRYARIAWPVELSDVLAVISEVVPESVALTSITVIPKMEAERITTTVDGPPAAEALSVELTGVAPSDLDVAGLIAGLEERGLFSRVAMDHARESVAGGAREFGLTCEIDLVSRRRKGTERPPAEAAK